MSCNLHIAHCDATPKFTVYDLEGGREGGGEGGGEGGREGGRSILAMQVGSQCTPVYVCSACIRQRSIFTE